MNPGQKFKLILDAEILGAKQIDIASIQAVLTFNPAIFSFEKDWETDHPWQGMASVKDGRLFIAPVHVTGFKMESGEVLNLGGKINESAQKGTYDVSVDIPNSSAFTPDSEPIEIEWHGVSVQVEKTSTGVKVKFTFRIE